MIEFVRDNIVYQVMGELRGKRYVPMITTVFCTLLVFNLCGIIPGFNIAASATITLPLVFAMCASANTGLQAFVKRASVTS